MVRRSLTAAAAIGCLILSGCSLIPPFPANRQSTPPPAPSLAPIEFTGETEVGACLELREADHPDLDSVVPCTEPHRFDVVAIGEWPGMTDAISVVDADAVWGTFTGNAYDVGAETDRNAYSEWADRFCADALREFIGWDDVSIRGIGADELGLLPAGSFEVNRTLAGHREFREGDHRTVCSLGWYEPIAFAQGVSIERLTSSGMPSASRECYLFTPQSSWGEPADCADSHSTQMIFRFEARAAFDDDLVVAPERLAPDTEEEFSAFCTEGVDSIFKGGDRDFYAWGQPDFIDIWSFDSNGDPFPSRHYFVACAVSRYDGADSTGDAFEGVARRADSAL